jgi:membrane protein
MLELLRETWNGFQRHKTTRAAAALAYYTLFSLPALLFIAISVAGVVARSANMAEDGQFRELIDREARESLGEGAAEQIGDMITRASEMPSSPLGIAIGIGMFLLGASGVMVQLQSALNEVWGVEPDPTKSSIWTFLLKRVISFGMVLGVGFLLLASLLISTILSTLGDFVAHFLGAQVSGIVPELVHLGANFLVSLLLFAAMFKWMPDVTVPWRSVLIGATFTAVMFIIGKVLLNLYFSNADVGSSFGAAGSLALILLWTYYTGTILLLGAEFTRAVASSSRGTVEPEPGARLIESEWSKAATA